MRDHPARPVQRLVPPLHSAWPGLLVLTLAIAQALLPPGAWATALPVAGGAFAALALTLAVVSRQRLAHRLAWALLAIATVLATLGQAIGTWLASAGQAAWAAEAITLASYLPLAVAAWWLAYGGGPGAWIDALLLSLVLALLAWLLPTASGDAGWALARSASAWLIWLLALRLAFSGPGPSLARHLLLPALLLYPLADLLPELTAPLRLLAHALLLVAAWHPLAAEAPPPARDALSRGRLGLLALAASVPPSLILILAAREEVQPLRLAALVALLVVLLVMLRLYGLRERARHQTRALTRLARRDPLTGAANRRRLEEFLTREMALATRHATPLSLALLDLDHFRRFNECQGRAGGDALLRTLVEAWQAALRPSDLLVRFGGEEFVVVLPDTDDEACLAVLERLRQRVPYGQTCSAGFARYRPGESPDALIQRADQALYQAKQLGRDRVEGALTY
ncbi:hypothetical protein HPA02_18010 [Bisbaumannia pacifica]|uniref:diguanylate cyclase n=1 Tax=Bisbaumannia pacifica TaxID=77098 RepID=A0A510X7U8_9GAMM|nr:GGDEF domain-containing protein [Halomonas pacifica]GEK47518.1 hypothetical protein HPA02_18010 [Halomonas pacifica]